MSIALALLGGLYLFVFATAVKSAKQHLPEQSALRWVLIGALTPFAVICAALAKLGYLWAKAFRRLEDRLFHVMTVGAKPSPPEPDIIHTNGTLQ